MVSHKRALQPLPNTVKQVSVLPDGWQADRGVLGAQAELEVLEEQTAAGINDLTSRAGHTVAVGDEQFPRSAGARAAAQRPDVSGRSLKPHAGQCDSCLHAELLQQPTAAPAAQPELDRWARVPLWWQPVLQGALRLPTTAHCLENIHPFTMPGKNHSRCTLGDRLQYEARFQ